MRAGILVAGAVTAGAVVVSALAGRQQKQGGAAPVPETKNDYQGVFGVEPITESSGLPRGIRNNNPLNIELGDPWKGLSKEQKDGRFAQFIDARYGFRAAARILQSYRRRGVVTVQQIIATWAPSFENDVRAYVDHVVKRSGLAPMQIVEREHYPRLLEAMTMHENGMQPYTLAYIREGVAWAWA